MNELFNLYGMTSLIVSILCSIGAVLVRMLVFCVSRFISMSLNFYFFVLRFASRSFVVFRKY